MKRISLLLLIALCGAVGFADPAAPISGYLNDFEKTPLGKPPEDLLILNGGFTVVQVENNKCLELAPDPLDADGLLFGPAGQITGKISARIWAAASGRRFPEFGVGANDAGGMKLIVIPAQGIIEIRHGEDAIAAAPFAWKSETWTRLKLEISKSADGKYQIQGKAWADGTPEPQGWTVTGNVAEAPPAGRASVWGMPYSGKVMRFDDLQFAP